VGHLVHALIGPHKRGTFSAVRALLPISFATLLLACQRSPPTTGEDTPTAASAVTPAQPAKPTCEAAPLQAELQTYCEFELGVPPLVLPKVGFTAETYHPLATRVITLTREGLTDPEGAAGTVSIQAWLADPPRRLPEPGELVLAIAADVPATTVAELQRGLAAAGREQVRYLVHVDDERPIPQPRDAKLLARMREALPIDPNERVLFVAQAVQGYAETCPPVAGVFPQLAQTSPGDRCAKLGELASKAIVECGCVELPEIMTLLYALTMGFDPPPGRAAAVPVILDPQAELVPAAGATWGDVASAQLRSTELHRLWIDAVAPPG
jgi:hypothetical protein